MAEVRSVEEKLRNELTLNARLRGRDKRGSPVEPQAIGMSSVLACRSGRAACRALRFEQCDQRHLRHCGCFCAI